ncbi:MarR family winged helix-turn-helix transcriptional regulator [Novosphingobium sp. 9]|uniref:MarR family winged helix-turn-helix transcriptional regulator n=1 Tax=Novosphingobium sp. 9 TaxID=2025349 RepID=UPI0021B52F50|nr:MarR family transcriptional regulator [Novosphingobium sp. 9]
MTDIPTEHLVEELLRSIGTLRRRLRAETNPDELTLSQISALIRLHKQGLATTADLARLEGVKPQSMGSTLGSLEKLGLVIRSADPNDARQMLYELTAEGIAAREQQRLLKRAWLGQAVSRLTEEEKDALGIALDVFNRIAKS